ncbi:MAG: tetratricopeptide repeat protein [Candidatus Pseudobacter hemicellulosilyticus]|uniref:Tetratricopeptide repeat protein n=1 Tax=Candidatus Pseudobacter hemicellulosilyticus TaxID=3121375 RepID=A0AAJ6BEU9_9BACT|nr:MAG: tetratricopeptide repeat protein [Pseudobacter sp.]
MRKYLIVWLSVICVTVCNAQDKDSATFYHQKGLTEKEARRYREAEKHFLRSLEFSAGNKQTLTALGDVLIEQNRYAEARVQFQKAEKIDPADPYIIEKLAHLSVNMRAWDDVIRYAGEMKKRKIGQPVNFIMAKAYYEQENYGEALKYCEYAFKDHPNNAEIPYIAGRCFIEMSNYKRAAGCYEQAIERDSTRVNWMYEAGLTYYAIPDDKKAIYWFEKAAAKGYKQTNDFLENLGSAYMNVGDIEKGAGYLKQVLARKPNDKELMYDIADAYYKSGKYQEAIDQWDQVLAVDKENANALFMIGMSYIKKGEKQKGQQLCDKAIEMDPSLKNNRQERKMPGGM